MQRTIQETTAPIKNCVMLNDLVHECFVACRDGDGILDEFDNCPDLPNGEQGDAEGDKKGEKKRSIIINRRTEVKRVLSLLWPE